MKTLFILRHAKSSWGDADLADFDRPLDERGLREAAFIGRHIAENEIKPNLILSSPAKRARHTTALVAETARLDAPTRFEEKIYEASPLTLLQVLAPLGDEARVVLLVGHNPGLEGLVKIMTGELSPMPTAGLAKINLEIEKWGDPAAGRGRLEFLLRPKEETIKSGG